MTNQSGKQRIRFARGDTVGLTRGAWCPPACQKAICFEQKPGQFRPQEWLAGDGFVMIVGRFARER
jgi:hypothetical protein